MCQVYFDTGDDHSSDGGPSNRSVDHDVPDPLQDSLRDTALVIPGKDFMDSSRVQHSHELDCGPSCNGELSRSQLPWLVLKLLQLSLSWAFLPYKEGFRQGLILVGVARCISMVLIWTGLVGGDQEYCAILVAINSVLQMILFAPLALLFIVVVNQGTNGDVDIWYTTVAKSVAVFLGIPLAAAIITRVTLCNVVGAN